jgi:nucleotide-binding universal stress UspA family protein
MIPKIAKILYATDLSSNSAFAFRYAVKMAQDSGAEIVILHVIEAISKSAQAMIEPYVEETHRNEVFRERISLAIERIEKRLKIFIDRELGKDSERPAPVFSIRVCEGYPAEEILNMSDEVDCDAVVLGTHAKGLISQTFLGSVAKRVLRRIRKPVFIIPLPKGETEVTVHDI